MESALTQHLLRHTGLTSKLWHELCRYKCNLQHIGQYGHSPCFAALVRDLSPQALATACLISSIEICHQWVTAACMHQA